MCECWACEEEYGECRFEEGVIGVTRVKSVIDKLPDYWDESGKEAKEWLLEELGLE